MLDKISTVNYLRMSLVLKDPSIEIDPAFNFTDEDLLSILELVASSHNPNYTLDNFPDSEKYFIVLLARKEIYYRLAFNSAPFYPLKAEGAELRKDFRFEHYMSLIRRVENEYALMLEQFTRNQVISTEAGNVGNLTLRSKHLTNYNYELAKKPEVEISIDNIHQNSVEFSWNQFNPNMGIFKHYEVYISTSLIYDEYEDVISKSATKVALITDIHKTKLRISELLPNMIYHVAVISEDLNRLKGISEKIITTLS